MDLIKPNLFYAEVVHDQISFYETQSWKPGG